MKKYITTPILILMGTFCSYAQVAPKGASIKTSKTGQAIITLEKGASIAIRQNKKKGIFLLISNLNGIIETAQINDKGEIPIETLYLSEKGLNVEALPMTIVPVTVKYLSDNKASIMTSRYKKKFYPLIIDNDGDGIPDIKVDLNKEGKLTRYKLLKIEWEEIEKPKK